MPFLPRAERELALAFLFTRDNDRAGDIERRSDDEKELPLLVRVRLGLLGLLRPDLFFSNFRPFCLSFRLYDSKSTAAEP